MGDAKVAFTSLGTAPGLQPEGSNSTQGPLIGLIALAALVLAVVGILATPGTRRFLASRQRFDAWPGLGVSWTAHRPGSGNDRVVVALGAVIAIGGGFAAAFYITTLL